MISHYYALKNNIKNSTMGGDMTDYVHKEKTKDKINEMLECLLDKDVMNCKMCKKCSSVDACCFLMDSVFVVHYMESRKEKSA